MALQIFYDYWTKLSLVTTSLNFWICLHRRVSLLDWRLYLSRRAVALHTCLSLETNLCLHMALHVLGQTWLSWELTTALSAHKNSGFAKGQHSFFSLQSMLFKVRSRLIIWRFSVEDHLLIPWTCFLNSILKIALFFFWDSTATRYNLFAWSNSHLFCFS